MSDNSYLKLILIINIVCVIMIGIIYSKVITALKEIPLISKGLLTTLEHCSRWLTARTINNTP